MIIDDAKIREIVEKEFERLINEKINGRDPSIIERIQALEDRIENLEIKRR